MRMLGQLLFGFLLSIVLNSEGAYAQGSFQNLGFESATAVQIPDDPFRRINFTQAFPGWMGFVGDHQEAAAGDNGTFICCSLVSLWGGPSNPSLALSGAFSVALHGALGDNGQPANTAIAQTGLVPLTAQSLLFRARGVGPWSVSLAGQTLPLVALSSSANYTVFGAEISAWAGQASELKFTAIALQQQSSFVVLDAIEFSPEPIPEPSVVTLIATAALVGLRHLRRRAQEASNKAEQEFSALANVRNV